MLEAAVPAERLNLARSRLQRLVLWTQPRAVPHYEMSETSKCPGEIHHCQRKRKVGLELQILGVDRRRFGALVCAGVSAGRSSPGKEARQTVSPRRLLRGVSYTLTLWLKVLPQVLVRLFVVVPVLGRYRRIGQINIPQC